MLELNQIYNIDCIDGMKQFPDKYFDAIITDPPYSFPDANIDVDWIPEAQRISKRMFVMVGYWALQKYLKEIDDYKDIIIFYSGSDKNRNIIPVIVSGDYKRGLNHISFNKHISTIIEKIRHPCPIPLDMMIELIGNYTCLDDKICDPFIGSGQTAIVCKKFDMDWIGFEINKDHHKEAIERIKKHE